MLQYIVCLSVLLHQYAQAMSPVRPSIEICELPSETGPCRARVRRFFHNVNTGRCEKFIFGGCRGNENSFKSEDECERVCGSHDFRRPFHPCPEVQCSRDCKYGYEHDIKGCSTCKCKPLPTPIKPICGHVCKIHCPFGNVLDKHGCPTCRCRPNPVIRPCPRYKCAVYCVDGYIKDKRGCTTCKCRHYPRPPMKGRCPRNSKSKIACPPMLSHDDCSVDEDCPGRKKCCTFGCSKKCINPRYSRPIWLY